VRRSECGVGGINVDAEEYPMVSVREEDKSRAVAGAKDNEVRIDD
jgi:hypothetical protein